jgi:hypothetical protein
MEYEKATLFARRSIKPPTNLAAKRVLTPEQKRRKAFLRKCRLERLDELIKRHAGDQDYFKSMSEWRREKLDLIEQL